MHDESYLPPENTVRKYIEKELSPRRVKHSLGVARVASELCYLEEIPEEKGKVAGLLHDHMRETDHETLYSIAGSLNIEIGEMERRYPALLHAVVGACLLPEKFGIRDSDIIEAVRYHTTGKSGMGKLARIIYIADKVEPSRDYEEVAKIKELAYNDLEKGFRECVKQHLRHILDRERQLHPDTVECWNELLEREVKIGRFD